MASSRDRDSPPGNRAAREPLNFHYDRTERLGDRPEPPVRGGFLFRNRSLAIVLIDLLVVFVVFVLLRLFLFTSEPPSASIGPFSVSLEAFEFEDEIYLTVAVEAVATVEPRAGEESLFTLRFPDGSSVTDILPVEEGGVVEVRKVVPVDVAEEGGVDVIIEIDGGQLEVSRTVGM